jgi:L-fuconolactonase
MTVVDSQVHVWGPDSPERPWPDRGGNLRHRFVPPDALVREMDEAGVGRAVLVPPVFEGDRNDVVIEAARRYPGRFAAMGRLPLDDPGSRERIHRWRDTPGMLGIRQSFFLPEHKRALLDGSTAWFWSAAESARIPLYVFCPGLLDVIGDVARRHPRLRIAISHFGLAPDADLTSLRAAVDALLALAPLPNVAVKASALPCHVAGPHPFPALREPIARVVAGFGADRVFWGSDLTRLPCTYVESATFLERLGVLSGGDLDRVMGAALVDWLEWDIDAAPREA